MRYEAIPNQLQTQNHLPKHADKQSSQMNPSAGDLYAHSGPPPFRIGLLELLNETQHARTARNSINILSLARLSCRLFVPGKRVHAP